MNNKRIFILVGSNGTLGKNIVRYIHNEYPNNTIITTYNSWIDEEISILSKGYKVDFTNLIEVDNFINKIKEYAHEDKLYINFIYMIGKYRKKQLKDFSYEEFSEDLDVNLKGLFIFISELIKKVSLAYFNSIYISSNLTLRCNKGTYSYVASKKAAESFLSQMAYEYKNNNNIRFNIIAPGYFGDMNEERNVKDNKIVNDICRAVKFFFESEKITGSKLVIDGGETIGY